MPHPRLPIRSDIFQERKFDSALIHLKLMDGMVQIDQRGKKDHRKRQMRGRYNRRQLEQNSNPAQSSLQKNQDESDASDFKRPRKLFSLTEGKKHQQNGQKANKGGK